MPWAYITPVKFEYPVEKAPVIQAYLKFSPWAISGSSQFPDWYLNNAGYRDNTVIYHPPAN